MSIDNERTWTPADTGSSEVEISLKKEKIMKFPKHIRVNIDIFNIDIYGFNTEKKYNKACKYVKIEGTANEGQYGNCTIMHNSDGSKAIYIGVFNKNASVAVHEFVHAADFIIEEYGIEDKEIRAYIVQFLYNVFIDYLAPKE